MKKILILLVCCVLCNAFAFAKTTGKSGVFNKTTVTKLKNSNSLVRQRVLTGTVYDEEGVSIPGVTIKVQGSVPERGVVTNADGKYTLQINSDSEILVFSFVGYTSQKITIGDKKVLDVKMAPDAKNALEEVAVVAFGTQKKESVIGSITTVRPGDLKVPSSNLTGALAGRVAGVIAYQRSGEPGADNADFFVRGITTFGANTGPLILIDGVELSTVDLARLQTDDIETFSIMKDATATSLYGARGANGVILVTTKKGVVGKANISLRAETSVSSPTDNVELADPVTYMKLANEAFATRDPLATLPYLEEKIVKTGEGANPLVYPANDWRKMLFKDNAINQRYNLNVRGGGAVATYYVAGAYTKDNGVLNVDERNNFNSNINLKSYSLLTNVTINLTKSTELGIKLSGNFDDYSGPLDGGAAMYNKVVHSNPVLFPAYYPVDAQHQYVRHIMFGNAGVGTTGAYINPYADMVRGYRDESRSQMLAQFEIKQSLESITKGLSVRTMLNLTRISNFGYERSYDPFYYRLAGYDPLADKYSISQINDNGTEYLGFQEGGKTLNSSFYNESMVNYGRTFGDKHDVSGLLVLIMRESLSANAGSLQQSLPGRNLGLSGRTTYAYDRRYFAEFNFGYNGTERFAEKNRFGFFPSGGVAWAISNEKFFEPLKGSITNLKLRYTYGVVGNDRIGDANDRFFYLSNVTMNDPNKGATFGRDLNFGLNGVTVNRYANTAISWERAIKQNMAMEISLFGKANIIAEYYTEQRSDILMSRASIPTTMGLAAITKANLGKASGRGVDIQADYQQAWSKDMFLSLKGNLTYATSKFKVYEEPEFNEPWRYRVGNSLAQNFGYIAERLFIDDEEAANSPRQEFGGQYGGGDIKYTDVNGDGRISEADMVPIGNPLTPEVIYGFGFSFKYKNIDFSAFAQGSANQSFWIDPSATAPFNNQTQLLKAYADSYWSEENRNVYAIWPRLSPTVNANNAQTSTWFMRNAAFLRIKQIELGYSLPKSVLSKIKAAGFRVYVNGSNLFMFSKFKMWDAEMAGNGLGYPVQKVFNVGVNLNFN
ncbi:SusC/RagA family TonB-linked outer membrane protein [Pedobacter metabolipauper]|uniref:TonB-linked SusC/RagA family outer membrane protein n=1 Tax=Pedobacter metabolipauper TaxID=425513 RepID=A0A4R6STT0_9SPHI|nr:TonB-dependent receptor [Pedobacter metabolipauper]TDQ08787.1 TonB-linked SusC/RagA family outer membrane protein [Pedobacter metabolipauper]